MYYGRKRLPKQSLGRKKIKKLEEFSSRKVAYAYAHNDLPHHVAEVYFTGESYAEGTPPPLINYKTGEVDSIFTEDFNNRNRIAISPERLQGSGTGLAWEVKVLAKDLVPLNVERLLLKLATESITIQ